MPLATELSPNVGNLYLGKGKLYWMGFDDTAFRDLGETRMLEITPSVVKLPHYSQMSGVRTKDLQVVTETNVILHAILEEFTPKNVELAMLGQEEVSFTLTTTGTVAITGVISAIASMAGILEGKLYNVSGPGIPAGATFEGPAAGITTVQIDMFPGVAAPTAGTGVALAISAPPAVNIFAIPEKSGRLRFVGANDVGPQWTADFPIVLLSPVGNTQLIGDAWGALEVEGDVTIDPAGNYGRLYWNAGTGID